VCFYVFLISLVYTEHYVTLQLAKKKKTHRNINVGYFWNRRGSGELYGGSFGAPKKKCTRLEQKSTADDNKRKKNDLDI
jgi:hypothetical protein